MMSVGKRERFFVALNSRSVEEELSPILITRYTVVPTIFAHEVFEEAVALSMSVEAFKRNRKVRWDPAKDAIVS